MEELRNYQESTVSSEWRETKFIGYMVDYLIWLHYFHGKLLRARVARAVQRINVQKLEHYFETQTTSLNQFHQELMKLRTANLTRIAIAERIHQVRLGAVLPIIVTAAALLSYICLPPLAYGPVDAVYARVLSGVAYVLASTAIGMNVGFGLWLLLPVTEGPRADLVYGDVE